MNSRISNIGRYVMMAVFCALIPAVLTLVINGAATQNTVVEDDYTKRIKIEGKGSSLDISISDYVEGVLAGRLQYGMDIELIKAQAVMVRTEAVKAVGDSTVTKSSSLPYAYVNEKDRRKMWNDNYEEYNMLIEDCVKAVEGIVITYGGGFINCPYTPVSAGKTRTYAGCGYLKAADCQHDIEADNYLNVSVIESDDFVKKCTKKFGDINLNRNRILETVQIVERDEAGYVGKMQLGEMAVSGEEFADALGLSSSCFYIESYDGNQKGSLRITTKGIGAGYGVSMYTARKMAEAGSSYEDILKFFYNEIDLVNE